MGSGDLRCLLHVKVTSPTPSEESWTSLRPVIRGENIHRNSTASSFWRRAIYFIFFILWKNNWLIMSLIFGVQQSYSVIHTHTHTHILLHILFPLWFVTEYWIQFAVLYPGPRGLSIQRIMVCICWAQRPACPSSSLPSWQPWVCSLCLWVCFVNTLICVAM